MQFSTAIPTITQPTSNRILRSFTACTWEIQIMHCGILFKLPNKLILVSFNVLSVPGFKISYDGKISYWESSIVHLASYLKHKLWRPSLAMQKRAKKGSNPLEGLEGVPWIVNLTIFTFIKPDDDVSTVLYAGNDFHSILEIITEILN